MSQETRYLINRIKKRKTQAGQDVVDLYAGGQHSKLRYPVLTLFDLAELTVIGIDPNTLGSEEHHARFWAYYEQGEKLNKEDNPYKNITYLEAIGPAPSPSAVADTERILDAMRILYRELKEIKETIQAIQAGKPAPAPQPTPAATVDEPPLPSLPENEARQTFYALLGPAIAAGTLSAQTGNDLATSANGNGWNSVLAQLQARLK